MRPGDQQRDQRPGRQEDLLLLREHHHVLHPDPADDDLLLHDRGQALLQQQPRGEAGRRHTSGIIIH